MGGPPRIGFVVTETYHAGWVCGYEIGARLAGAAACAILTAGGGKHLPCEQLVQRARTGVGGSPNLSVRKYDFSSVQANRNCKGLTWTIPAFIAKVPRLVRKEHRTMDR
jgi:hypothetical protein